MKNKNSADAAARLETHLICNQQAVKQSKQKETIYGGTGN
jgi:hypothetical protein